MPNRDVLKRHAGLVDQMADTLGVDLEEQTLRGEVSIDDISDAVLNCTGCSNPDHCEGWLAEKQGDAARPPGYCRNVDLLMKLAGRPAL